jgi:xanthine/uracil/vitamin C permease (AzgA family)
MSFGFVTLGCLFLVAGAAYLAYLMELPETYVIGPVLILVGIGVLTGAQSVRRSRIREGGRI